MRAPISWIKEYVEIKEPAEKLAEDLQFSGTKVASIASEGTEVIFDFEITPNRPDCLSVIGIAREIAAIYQRKLTTPSAFSVKKEEKSVRFEVADKKLCPSYSLGVIDYVKVGPSPDWLAKRLEKSGLRSINNIVDITNYVMLEIGQPMHAFDYDKISGVMNLRASKIGETLVTLDGVKRVLPAGAIIIEDKEKIVDLAGLMGGENSEVDENTQTLILHVPLYNPLAIRKASQYLGLRSEASNRFEKKLDPNAHRYAFERTAQLMGEVAGAKLASEVTSVGYPHKEGSLVVPFSLISEVLGISISKEQIKNILERLGFATQHQVDKADEFKLQVPTFRTDIEEPIDIVEEVGRIYGYNNFPKTLPSSPSVVRFPRQTDFEAKVKEALALLGLKEVYTGSLTSAKILDRAGIRVENCLKVANRLVIDYEYLRPTLIVGLLLTSLANIERFERFSLFEVGRIFEKNIGKNGLPSQPKKIAGILINYDFKRAKGIVENFLDKLAIGSLEFMATENNSPYGSTIAKISSVNKSIGTLGSIEEKILTSYDISASTYAFELDFEILRSLQSERKYKPPPKYPIVKENISLFVNQNTKFSNIQEAIRKGAGHSLFNLTLLEEKSVKGKRSLLLGIEYFDLFKTLERRHIEVIREKVLKELVNIDTQPRIS